MTTDEQGADEHDAMAQERLAQQERWSDAAIDREPVLGQRGKQRLLWGAAVLLGVVLLVTLPPLINVNRYQHRVASSISGSIGRPVRFDAISLHLLPWPSFTIENFVVGEDPAFGAEPAMRANRVDARIRLMSLWLRRVEVSHITLESPTVNLVRNAAGYWNMQGVVTQAAQVRSAPTAQPRAGDAPRFPYIEGSDARVSVKLDETKLPFALVDAEFALWLPSEQEWHLRMAGRPLRSDTDASDVGQLRLEATLSRNGSNMAMSPLTLQAQWKPTPLGEASKLVVGRDTGWRGMASAELAVQGTPGNLRMTTDVHVHDLRRAEFVPPETVQMDAHCEATALGMGRELSRVRCTLPTGASSSLLDSLSFNRSSTAAGQPAPDVLRLDGTVPDTLDLRQSTVQLVLAKGSPAWGMRWLRLFSRRMPPSARVGGTLAVSASHAPGAGWSGTVLCHCMLPLRAEGPAGAGVDGAGTGGAAVKVASPWTLELRYDPDSGGTAQLEAGAEPASPADGTDAGQVPALAKPAVTGTLSPQGVLLNYVSARLPREFAGILPALGDNLPAGLSGPVVSHRVWGERQVWTAATPQAAPRRRRRGTQR